MSSTQSSSTSIPPNREQMSLLSYVKLAAQILGLVILIIKPLLALPREQMSLLSYVKLAAQILGLVILILKPLLALPRFQQVKLVLELIHEAIRTLVSIVVLLQRLIHDLHQIISMAHDGFQQAVSVLELIDDVVGSLVNFVVLLLRLIRICRRIWSILTARQPVVVANDHQNEVPLADINYGQNDILPTDAEADATNGQNNVIVNEELNI